MIDIFSEYWETITSAGVIASGAALWTGLKTIKNVTIANAAKLQNSTSTELTSIKDNLTSKVETTVTERVTLMKDEILNKNKQASNILLKSEKWRLEQLLLVQPDIVKQEEIQALIDEIKVKLDE